MIRMNCKWRALNRKDRNLIRKRSGCRRIIRKSICSDRLFSSKLTCIKWEGLLWAWLHREAQVRSSKPRKPQSKLILTD